MNIKNIATDLMDSLDEEMISPETGDYAPNHSQVAQALWTLSAVVMENAEDAFAEKISELMCQLSEQILEDAKAKDLLNIPATIHADLWNERAWQQVEAENDFELDN